MGYLTDPISTLTLPLLDPLDRNLKARNQTIRERNRSLHVQEFKIVTVSDICVLSAHFVIVNDRNLWSRCSHRRILDIKPLDWTTN
jgi:hypothetical protein